MCICRTKYSHIQCFLIVCHVIFLTPLSLRHITWDEISRFNFTHNSGFLSPFISCHTECHIILCILLPPNVNVISCPFKLSFPISSKSQLFLILYQLSLRFSLHFVFIESYNCHLILQSFWFCAFHLPSVTKIWI